MFFKAIFTINELNFEYKYLNNETIYRPYLYWSYMEILSAFKSIKLKNASMFLSWDIKHFVRGNRIYFLACCSKQSLTSTKAFAELKQAPIGAKQSKAPAASLQFMRHSMAPPLKRYDYFDNSDVNLQGVSNETRLFEMNTTVL